MSDLMQKIISLCKRRGFIFPSSEIYGGFGSCYDFGPLGTEMKNNIKKEWWDEMTKEKDKIVGLDSAILMNPKVWQASGHLTAGFAEELVECKKCHHRFRKDFLKKNNCPDCGGELTKPRKFNLMMKTFIGPVEDEAAVTYLRAETCQGIYLNFSNVLNSMRLKIPFGIAQIGKAFRNEITPGNFIFRTREFEQMEMQWFCHPEEADKYFDYWKKERLNWYFNLGIKKEKLRTSEIPKQERAHYARKQVDIEYKFPFGWKEIEGIHNRGDWDLSNHSKYSGKDLRYVDELRSSSRVADARVGEEASPLLDHSLSSKTRVGEEDSPLLDPSLSSKTRVGEEDSPLLDPSLSSKTRVGEEDSPLLDPSLSSKTRVGEEKYFPYIIETSVGADRSFLAFLIDAYSEIKGGRTKTTESAKEEEIVLKLEKRLAPIKVAVLPLVRNKPELVKKAREIYQLLKPHFVCRYDEMGSIGRRYRRMDEAGCLFAVTIDFETPEKETVTLRDRDTMKQKRIKIKNLSAHIKELLSGA